MKLSHLILYIILFFFSCVEYPHNETEIFGKYFSLNDEIITKEFIEFYPDNNYYHCFYNKNIAKKFYGKWKLLDKKGTLHLTNWVNYNGTDDTKSKPSDHMVTVNNNEIIFSGDDYKKNFKKITQ